MRKFLLTKPRADVMALMIDGRPRTVREIGEALRGGYNSGLGAAVTKLVRSGELTSTASGARAPLYCLPRTEPIISRSGTNPFEWQTYKQYEPETV